MMTKNKRPTTRKGREESKTMKRINAVKEREDIIRMVNERLTDKEIAEKLGIKVSNLKYRRKIYGIKRAKGRPMGKGRVKLDLSLITDKATREDREWEIAAAKRNISDNKQLKAEYKYGNPEIFDVFIEATRKRLYNLENPTVAAMEKLIKGHKKGGRPKGDGYTAKERYNMQLDTYIKESRNIEWEDYKIQKAEYLVAMELPDYYEHMLFTVLPKDGFIFTGKFDRDMIDLDAVDTEW